jgi:hypothetical protein
MMSQPGSKDNPVDGHNTVLIRGLSAIPVLSYFFCSHCFEVRSYTTAVRHLNEAWDYTTNRWKYVKPYKGSDGVLLYPPLVPGLRHCTSEHFKTPREEDQKSRMVVSDNEHGDSDMDDANASTSIDMDLDFEVPSCDGGDGDGFDDGGHDHGGDGDGFDDGGHDHGGDGDECDGGGDGDGDDMEAMSAEDTKMLMHQVDFLVGQHSLPNEAVTAVLRLMSSTSEVARRSNTPFLRRLKNGQMKEWTVRTFRNTVGDIGKECVRGYFRCPSEKCSALHRTTKLYSLSGDSKPGDTVEFTCDNDMYGHACPMPICNGILKTWVDGARTVEVTINGIEGVETTAITSLRDYFVFMCNTQEGYVNSLLDGLALRKGAQEEDARRDLITSIWDASIVSKDDFYEEENGEYLPVALAFFWDGFEKAKNNKKAGAELGLITVLNVARHLRNAHTVPVIVSTNTSDKCSVAGLFEPLTTELKRGHTGIDFDWERVQVLNVGIARRFPRGLKGLKVQCASVSVDSQAAWRVFGGEPPTSTLPCFRCPALSVTRFLPDELKQLKGDAGNGHQTRANSQAQNDNARQVTRKKQKQKRADAIARSQSRNAAEGYADRKDPGKRKRAPVVTKSFRDRVSYMCPPSVAKKLQHKHSRSEMELAKSSASKWEGLEQLIAMSKVGDINENDIDGSEQMKDPTKLWTDAELAACISESKNASTRQEVEQFKKHQRRKPRLEHTPVWDFPGFSLTMGGVDAMHNLFLGIVKWLWRKCRDELELDKRTQDIVYAAALRKNADVASHRAQLEPNLIQISFKGAKSHDWQDFGIIWAVPILEGVLRRHVNENSEFVDRLKEYITVWKLLQSYLRIVTLPALTKKLIKEAAKRYEEFYVAVVNLSDDATGLNISPNFHFAFHIALTDLEARGPVQQTWCYPHEGTVGVAKNTTTNNKTQSKTVATQLLRYNLARAHQKQETHSFYSRKDAGRVLDVYSAIEGVCNAASLLGELSKVSTGLVLDREIAYNKLSNDHGPRFQGELSGLHSGKGDINFYARARRCTEVFTSTEMKFNRGASFVLVVVEEGGTLKLAPMQVEVYAQVTVGEENTMYAHVVPFPSLPEDGQNDVFAYHAAPAQSTWVPLAHIIGSFARVPVELSTSEETPTLRQYKVQTQSGFRVARTSMNLYVD